MLRDEIYIKRYDWHVVVYYAVDCYKADEICRDLESIGCDRENLERARENLTAGELDTGLTYSNTIARESIMVVSLSSSPDEYANSIAHESMHLVMHIAHTFGIDCYGEEVCYLAGSIAQKLNMTTRLLVDGCKCSKGIIAAKLRRCAKG